MNNPLNQKITLTSLLKFAFPTIIMMIFMGLYTIIDTIFVARFINSDALSAINIVCPIINIVIGLIFALIITIIGTVFIDQIIWQLGASERLFNYCKDYLLIIIIFTPTSFLQILFQNLIITAGIPKIGLLLSISAGIINITFDYIFIIPLNMGIAGSALATCLGFLNVSLAEIYLFTVGKGSLHFVTFKFNHLVIINSCSNVVSEMVSQLATAITTFLFNQTMMNLAGENGVAAITIIIYSQFLLTAFYIGFSMGISPIISYNYGANNHVNLNKIFKLSRSFILITSIIFIISFLLGKTIINIFASAFFTALSNGRISAIISFLRTLGFITIALITLPKFFSINGVWIAIPLAKMATIIIAIILIIKYKKIYNY